MADLLDQSEVDALLAAVNEGNLDEDEVSEPMQDERVILSHPRRSDEMVDVRTYDFKRPERVSKEQMRALQTMYEAFARNFGASLSGFLRTIVEVKVPQIEQLTYQEFIHALPNPTCFNLLSCDKLEGNMCLEISPLIIYPIIDRLLGGTNSGSFIPQRPLTAIELRLVKKITDRATTAMADAWSNVLDVQFWIDDEPESNPQLVQIVPPNEVVVNITFELKMTGRTGTMALCIPFNVIEPVMDKLVSQSWNAYGRGKKDPQSRRQIAETISQAPLQTTAILAETKISVHDLIRLEPGDCIQTEKNATSPIVLCVEGKKKFLGLIGEYKGKRAIRIVKPFTPRDRV